MCLVLQKSGKNDVVLKVIFTLYYKKDSLRTLSSQFKDTNNQRQRGKYIQVFQHFIFKLFSILLHFCECFETDMGS